MGLWPREHGAWGLLLQPFVAGAVLAGERSWMLAPALGLVLTGFLLRAPLVILARQAFVWRERNPLTRAALHWLLWELLVLAGCCAWLLQAVSPGMLALFVGGGAILTLTAVWMTVRNRQRSLAFQVASAVALGSTAPFAVLVARGTMPWWTWILWGLLAMHGIAAILAVHTRLERRVAAHGKQVPSGNAGSYAIQALQAPIGGILGFYDPLLILPPLFSVLVNCRELRLLNTKPGLGEPLTRVGVRTLANALVHLALTIACLVRTTD